MKFVIDIPERLAWFVKTEYIGNDAVYNVIKQGLPFSDGILDEVDFPDTYEEFANLYGFRDTKEVYTNGVWLIPNFRVKQWLNHLSEIHTGEWIEHEIEDTYRWLTCSKCGYEWINRKENYCPDCGCFMKGRNK